MDYKRVFIEKKQKYNTEASLLKKDLEEYLAIENLEELRVINIYDIVNASSGDIDTIVTKILYEDQLDLIYHDLQLEEDERAFRLRFIEGQYNQREDAANEMFRLISGREDVRISNTRLYIFKGISQEDFDKIRSYYINPVEMKEIGLEDLVEDREIIHEARVARIENFKAMTDQELSEFKEDFGIGLDLEDLKFCQDYFAKRDPSITELKLIDTYWSDHCRHTTFMTQLDRIDFQEGAYEKIFQEAYNNYLDSRQYVYGDRKDKPICLMDLATINQKELAKKGLLDDKEDTDEVNAASIEIDVDVDGTEEKWLLMFKNETHNHPTEIEPFGGAATCLGGAIRDPLSGRSYVYQAMRITGSGDPRQAFEDTLEGKLAQRKITRTARDGYSSYGYEIGAATGYVREIYDQGYVAKRMEVGALVAAAPKENVFRGQAEPGDLVVLVGGRTGRDGLGGAVGSSRKHTEESLEDSGAEVQKGNPKIERKIIRLFRRKEVSTMIKVCNDFGAGGVSVAIGELADGVDIDLDRVPLKYRGLDGTEIALSESQERMAVVIGEGDLEKFLEYSEEEDLEASLVARVTEDRVLRMTWQDDEIVRIDREFLDTNGIRKHNDVRLLEPVGESFFRQRPEMVKGHSRDFINNFKDLNIASQKGLGEGFDFSVGRGTVLAPFGGRTRLTQAEGMVAKLPVLEGETKTCSLMTYGFEPKLTRWSCFHGGYYAVIDSVARMVALGASHEKIRLSFQEYFQRLGEDRDKWGQAFSALLGAYEAQRQLDIAAIGGKDSMSGSFEDLHVPPTIISFAVTTDRVENILSPEFKKVGSEVGLVGLDIDQDYLVDFDELVANYGRIKELVDEGKILAASSLKYGGIARSIGEMSVGNLIGFEFSSQEDLYSPLIGSIIVELEEGERGEDLFKGLNYRKLGETIAEEKILLRENYFKLEEVIGAMKSGLESTFPLAEDIDKGEIDGCYEGLFVLGGIEKSPRPRVLIPVVSGTHGEYDMARAFEKAGGQVDIHVIRTGSKEDFDRSLRTLGRKLKNIQILALPDGKILGDEPEAGGKLYSYIFENPYIKEGIEEHIYENNGLIIGIGAGFETLIKTGLIEYGEIRRPAKNSIYITSNQDAGFVAEMVNMKVKSNLSPWLNGLENNHLISAPLASKEARIVGGNIERMIRAGQVALVFDRNLTGSSYSIAGLSSPGGRIFGCLASLERIDEDLYKNIDKAPMHKIFEAGINYFK